MKDWKEIVRWGLIQTWFEEIGTGTVFGS
jgi:hypothetical protein